MWFAAQNTDISAFFVKFFCDKHCDYFIVTINIEDLFLWKVSTGIWDYVKSLHLGIYMFAYIDNLYKPELCMAWTQRKHFQSSRMYPTELNSTVSILQNIFCVKS